MGATYLSLQLRMTDRDTAVGCLESIAAANAAAGLQFYVTEPIEKWLAVFPNFTPELERIAKALSAQLDCLVLLLLSADEDDLYLMFFRSGKQLPWFKVGVGRKRTGKERDKLATKLEALADGALLIGILERQGRRRRAHIAVRAAALNVSNV